MKIITCGLAKEAIKQAEKEIRKFGNFFSFWFDKNFLKLEPYKKEILKTLIKQL